ncbi:patatin-like phospholipase family protein [Bacteroides sp. 51]|uniref:patatin-like phospholipase family protein n=1 Tax=Bacteroides sp. 51 TaxID=2302938 RepID=UPI0013D0FDE5|nr:patatin-like phospholipase family protein [Bacteroides sp. 51]NDV82631.1 phospholipase [Bacteroides sp. 51]
MLWKRKKRAKKPYKLGLVLSGGGARGYAHLGALKALNERGIYPDIIAGTSVGSLIGVLYADGYTPDEMFSYAKTVKLWELVESTLPRDGIFKATGIGVILRKYLRVRTFEELKLPMNVVASDIECGEVKVFNAGKIIPAVIASCSVPIVFTPVEIDGHHYVDGGLLKNFPVSAIREQCDKVIGIDISPVISVKYDRSMKYIVERAMNYMVGANTIEERAACDYLIESGEVSVYSLFDFKHVEEIYEKGYEAAARYLDANMELLKKDFGI